MSYVSGVIGIVLAFSFMVFIASQQRTEIVSLKSQLSIAQDYERDRNDTDSQLVQCSNDVDYMKNSLEDLIYASEHGLK